MSTGTKQTRRAAHERRLQAALRENLHRRKAQARGRAAATNEQPGPAERSDERERPEREKS
jgi:hypothetical protein